MLILSVFSLCPLVVPAASITEDTQIYHRDRPIGTLRRGTEVTVVSDDGEWVRIVYETMDARFDGSVKKGTLSMTDASPDGGSRDTPDAGAGQGHDSAAVAPDREISLSSYWMNGSKNMSQSYADFVGLLKDFGSGRFQPKPDRGYTIYGKLTYLMPINDAIKTLGLAKVSAEVLKSPGLPSDSLTGHSADGFFDGFSRIMLVSDRKGQLVSVQLGDRNDRGPWLREDQFRNMQPSAKRVEYSDRWRVVSFLEGRMKGSASWRVGYYITKKDGVVRVDSEMISGEEWQGRSKERYRTYLPTPVVDLLLQMSSGK